MPLRVKAMVASKLCYTILTQLIFRVAWMNLPKCSGFSLPA
uniref:Uncharacterized protein n=1 Tax=Picea sitchensis TaxID=3332 RepID=A9NW69_PICSI|nr:unknown [Picea sitchensis]